MRRDPARTVARRSRQRAFFHAEFNMLFKGFPSNVKTCVACSPRQVSITDFAIHWVDLRDGLFVHVDQERRRRLHKQRTAQFRRSTSITPRSTLFCFQRECEGGRDRYEPMPSRGVQLIKRGSYCNACPIVPAQFFPRLAGFVFCLFVSHKGCQGRHIRLVTGLPGRAVHELRGGSVGPGATGTGGRSASGVGGSCPGIVIA